MVLFMKDNGKIIWNMESENNTGLKTIKNIECMKVNGKMIWLLDMVHIHGVITESI